MVRRLSRVVGTPPPEHLGKRLPGRLASGHQGRKRYPVLEWQSLPRQILASPVLRRRHCRPGHR